MKVKQISGDRIRHKNMVSPQEGRRKGNIRSAVVTFREYNGMDIEMYLIVKFQNVDKNSGP